MSTPSPFRLGIVEGFFGRQWSWQARRQQASFVASQAFTTYLYAPKNDAFLRKRWFDLYPPDEFHALTALARHAAALNLEFGVGLSPFELYRDDSPSKREALRRKIEQLNLLQAPLLAVLFDDMLGALPGLADRQLALFEFILRHSSATQFMLCPTYYSDDPLLVKHFGAQPERYLEQLGEALPASVGVFWTGPRVVSASYPREHLLDVGQRLRRKPLLWDNYPVNDAKRLAPFLNLGAFAERDDGRFQMQPILECCNGLLANPMNQAALSRIPLASLAMLTSPSQSRRAPMAVGDPAVLALLAEDGPAFQRQGLDAFDAAARAQLLARYEDHLPDDMAAEVCDWLRGGYAFDPACLT